MIFFLLKMERRKEKSCCYVWRFTWFNLLLSFHSSWYRGSDRYTSKFTIVKALKLVKCVGGIFLLFDFKLEVLCNLLKLLPSGFCSIPIEVSRAAHAFCMMHFPFGRTWQPLSAFAFQSSSLCMKQRDWYRNSPSLR